MNTETIRHTAIPASSTMTAWLIRIRCLFTRHPKKIVYDSTNASIGQGDLLRGLPIEEKLRLGMYQYMD